ncbi:MAG TPA: hypothetical protein VKY85_08455 [Candidatus Angelobacter sp.]|nr:hypothetical protein [Candidatus Angelobacter sp.]
MAEAVNLATGSDGKWARAERVWAIHGHTAQTRAAGIPHGQRGITFVIAQTLRNHAKTHCEW